MELNIENLIDKIKYREYLNMYTNNLNDILTNKENNYTLYHTYGDKELKSINIILNEFLSLFNYRLMVLSNVYQDFEIDNFINKMRKKLVKNDELISKKNLNVLAKIVVELKICLVFINEEKVKIVDLITKVLALQSAITQSKDFNNSISDTIKLEILNKFTVNINVLIANYLQLIFLKETYSNRVKNLDLNNIRVLNVSDIIYNVRQIKYDLKRHYNTFTKINKQKLLANKTIYLLEIKNNNENILKKTELDSKEIEVYRNYQKNYLKDLLYDIKIIMIFNDRNEVGKINELLTSLQKNKISDEYFEYLNKYYNIFIKNLKKYEDINCYIYDYAEEFFYQDSQHNRIGIKKYRYKFYNYLLDNYKILSNYTSPYSKKDEYEGLLKKANYIRDSLYVKVTMYNKKTKKENELFIMFPFEIEDVKDFRFKLKEKISSFFYNMYPMGYYEEDFNVTITIPTSVSCIPDNCFKEISVIHKVIFPYNLESIGNHAFYNCENLENIEINSVETIGIEAFMYTKLKEVEFSYVNRIKDGAFSGCENLKLVKINNENLYNSELKYIGKNCFKDCTMLEEIEIYSKEKNFTIGDYAFFNCKSLFELNIDTPKEIKGCAFSNCSNLEVYFSKCTTISAFAFLGCDNLRKIILPNIRKIANNAFEGCNNLTEIETNNTKYKDILTFKNNILNKQNDLELTRNL